VVVVVVVVVVFGFISISVSSLFLFLMISKYQNLSGFANYQKQGQIATDIACIYKACYY